MPHWMGGLPADAPPRRGTPEYDYFMAKRAQEAARAKQIIKSGDCSVPLGGTIHLALHSAPLPPQGVIHPISFGVGIFHFLLTRSREHRGVTFSLGEGS